MRGARSGPSDPPAPSSGFTADPIRAPGAPSRRMRSSDTRLKAPTRATNSRTAPPLKARPTVSPSAVFRRAAYKPDSVGEHQEGGEPQTERQGEDQRRADRADDGREVAKSDWALARAPIAATAALLVSWTRTGPSARAAAPVSVRRLDPQAFAEFVLIQIMLATCPAPCGASGRCAGCGQRQTSRRRRKPRPAPGSTAVCVVARP